MNKALAKKYTRLVLEKRIVFDAAAIQTAADVSDAANSAETDALVEELSTSQNNTENETLFDILTAPATQSDSNRSVLIVDSRVENLESLLVDLAPNTDVFILDANQDGVEQINSILANYENLSSIQILSHADDATLILGNTVLNNSNIDSYAETLSGWGDALTDTGDILLYGCDVANGADGLAFIQSLADYTRADVAASNDDTGAGSQNADWDLEVQTGSIEADSVLSEEATAGYDEILATITFDGGAGTAFWDDAANWSGDTIPQVGDDVLLSGVNVIIRDAQQVLGLSLINGATLAVDASADLTLLVNGGSIDATSTFDGNGTLRINGGDFTTVGTNNFTGDLSLEGGVINIFGGFDGLNPVGLSSLTVTNLADVVFSSEPSSSLNVGGTTTINSGTLFIGNTLVSLGAQLTVDGGVLNISSTNASFALGDITQTAGTITGTTDLVVNGAYDWLGGTISGTGLLTTGFVFSSVNIEGGIVSLERVFNNAGLLYINGGSIDLANSGEINNNGVIQIDSSGIAFSDTTMTGGGLTNNGNFDLVNFELVIDDVIAIVDVNFINTGTIQLGQDQEPASFNTLTITNRFDNSSGLITGTGALDISTALVNALGAISPGDVIPGPILISGDINLDINSQLIIDLDGIAPLNDSVLVLGDLVLDGTIDLNFLSGFEPTVGQTFNLVTANTIIDNGIVVNSPAGFQFSTSLINNNTGLLLTTTAVPDLASDDSFSVNEDNAVLITIDELLANDSAGLSFTGIGTGPSNGTLTFLDAGISYQPDANFNGIDSFTYTVTNGQTQFIATVTITVDPTTDTVTWTNGSGDNRWENAANWDIGFAPQNGDDVIVNDLTGSIIFSAASGTLTLNSLTSNENDFRITGGSLLLGNDVSDVSSFAVGSNITLSNGELGGLGSTTLDGSDFVFNSGTISGNLNISSTSTLDFSGGIFGGTLSGNLTNEGVVRLSATARAFLAGGSIDNRAGATFEFASNGDLQISGISSIINNGFITKVVGSGAGDSVFSVVGGSTLNLSGNGVYDAQTGTISINGNTDYAAGFTANGTGAANNALRLTGGIQNFDLASPATFNNGQFVFTSGTINGGLNITNTATLDLAGGIFGGTLSGNLINEGTVQLSATARAFLAGGSIDNRLGATFEFTNNGDLEISGTSSIINNGSIIKNSGTGDSVFSVVGGSTLNLSGNGVYDAQTGTISINGNTGYAAGFTANGTGAANNALRLTGGIQNFDLASPATFNNGQFVFTSGTINGGLNITNTATLDLAGGIFGGTLSGNLINEGTVQLSATARAFLAGGSIDNRLGATFEFTNNGDLEISGASSITNNGSIIKSFGTGDSVFSVVGAGSTLNLSGSGVYDAQTGTISINGNTDYAAGFTANGTGAANNALRLTGGIQNFDLASPATFNNGQFVFTSGTINGGLNITNTATLDLAGGIFGGTLSGNLINEGTVQLSATARAFLAGGSIDNRLGATFEFTNNGDLEISGTSSIINNGSIIKSFGTGDSVFSVVGGSTLNLSGNGVYDAQTGTISINGNTDYAAGFTANGTGAANNALRLTGGIQNFDLASPATFNNGQFVFTSGTINGGLNITNTATLDLAGGIFGGTLSGNLVNDGVVRLSATVRAFLTGGSIDNRAGATFEFASDGDLQVSGASSFINTGTILKSVGTGVSSITNGSMFTNNGGVIDAQTGTISLPASITSTGYNLQGNGTINLNGTSAPITDIRPGNSGEGILDITGDLDFDAATLFSVDIGGLNVGIDYDQVRLTGTANLNGGSVDVSFLNGFEGQLASGQVFTIATYAASTGSVANLSVNVPQGLNISLNDTGTALELIVNNNDPVAVDDLSFSVTNRVSVDVVGNDANNTSSAPSISADGRYIVFQSSASDLVTGDTNGTQDIFLTDTLTGVTSLISIDSQGGQANSFSSAAKISADGRFVTFLSTASNLVATDTNGATDLFLHEIQTGITTLVSVSNTGAQTTGASIQTSSISGDGRFVVFRTFASNLVAGDNNGTGDVFMRDTLEGTTTLISANAAGDIGNSASFDGSVSADGRFVVFSSLANNLIADDTNFTRDIFVKDVLTGIVTRVNVDSNGNQSSTGTTSISSISDNGRFVAFSSSADDLVAGDTNEASDVFVRDTLTGVTTRVTVDSAGNESNGDTRAFNISADGRFVVFSSAASNLVTGDVNGQTDVFIHDRQTGITSIVESTGQASAFVNAPVVSANGTVVAFDSDANNLVQGDGNAVTDIFVNTVSNFTTDENTAFTTSNVLTNDVDPDGDTLSVIAVDTTSTLGIVINNGDGTFNYDPNGAFAGLNDGDVGIDTFSYTVGDGSGGMSTATVTITVNGVGVPNTAPIANDDTFILDVASAESGAFLNVLMNDTDPDLDDSLNIDSITQPVNGTVDIIDGFIVRYTSNIGFRGNDSFTYTIIDTGGLESTATVDVTVSNADPVAGDDNFVVAGETSTLLNVLSNDFDPDSDGVIISDFTQPANGAVTLQQGGVFSYVSNVDFSGIDTFTYTVDDGDGGVDTATVSVDVLAIEAVSVRGDSTQTTDVLQGVLVTFTQGANGTVIDNGDGTFTYQADLGFRGADSFTVTTTIGANTVAQVVNVAIQDTFNQFWTGAGVDNDFYNPDNWNTGLAPISGDDITIPDGTDIITISNGNSVTLNSLTLSDTLIVSNGTITVAGATTILNTGVLDIAAGQSFTVADPDPNDGVDVNFVNNGTIFGQGTLDVTQATSFINNGILSPGNSPGALTINGDFTQTTSGTIILEIAGLTPGTQYDQLIINGTATLNGTVNIVLLNGFVLPANGNFSLISATSILGTPTINTPAGVTFDLFTGATTSSTTTFNGAGTFTFGPTGTGTTGFISISGPTYTYEPIQVASAGSTVTPIVYRTVADTEWTGVIDDLTVALVDEGRTNDELIAEFEALLESDPTAAGETLSEYELKLEEQLELAVSQFSKDQLAVLDILLQTPDTLSCR